MSPPRLRKRRSTVWVVRHGKWWPSDANHAGGNGIPEANGKIRLPVEPARTNCLDGLSQEGEQQQGWSWVEEVRAAKEAVGR